MLLLYIPIGCWVLITILVPVFFSMLCGKINPILVLLLIGAVWAVGIGYIWIDPWNEIPDNSISEDTSILASPGYGWSCVPVNTSDPAGGVLCRPVTLGGS